MPSTSSAEENQLVTGSWLCSKSSKYLVQSFLGEGSFGKVVKCARMDDMKTVAIKLIKNKGVHREEAKKEVLALLKLKVLDPDKCNIVQWYQVFCDREHICLEFEHLDKSLYDFLKERYFQPLLLKEIRAIVEQLAIALDHLKAVGIIHADLKLENVMLVNHAQQPYRVKLIDFGIACKVSAATVGSYIQTRAYRSPEIILGLPFTEAIDMWSLGCLAASLYLGDLLYPGNSEYDMMRYIVETQGQPPDELLTVAHKTCRFFERDHKSTTSLWKLKTPERVFRKTGTQSKETRMFKLSSLDDLLHTRVSSHEISPDGVAEMTDQLMFVDMLKGMLHLDAAKRSTPRQVLEHHFISMCHIISLYSLSPHVESCFEIMSKCQYALTPDSGKAESESSEQPSPRTAQEKSPPSPPVEKSSPSKSPYINPHPSISTQTPSSVKSGMKRKVDDDDDNDENMHETSHLSKRAHYVEPGTAPMSRPAKPLDHSTPKTSIRQGIKRKRADGENVEHRHRSSDRSHDDRKRICKRHASPFTSTSTHSQAHRCVSPRHKRKVTHDEDSHYYEWSGHKRRKLRERSASRASHTRHHRPDRWSSPAEHRRQSTHPDSSKTESQARTGRKRSAPSSVKSGMKTKADYDENDENMHETSHLSKRARYVEPGTAPMSRPAKLLDHSTPKTSDRQGIKRKTADGENVERRHRSSDRSHDDRKRICKRHASPSTSTSTHSQAHRCVSPRHKRKVTHDEDSHYYEWSDHKRRKIRERSASRASHTRHHRPDRRSSPAEHRRQSTRPDSNKTESQARTGRKRSADDDEEWCRKRTSDRRSHEDRRRHVEYFKDKIPH